VFLYLGSIWALGLGSIWALVGLYLGSSGPCELASCRNVPARADFAIVTQFGAHCKNITMMANVVAFVRTV
jgi:hypothetical protein